MDKAVIRTIRPDYSEFQDLEVELRDARDGASWLRPVAHFLADRCTTEAIALTALVVVVVGVGFVRCDNAWALFAIDLLIVAFSMAAILIGRADAKTEEETSCLPHESGDEPQRPRQAGESE